MEVPFTTFSFKLVKRLANPFKSGCRLNFYHALELMIKAGHACGVCGDIGPKLYVGAHLKPNPTPVETLYQRRAGSGLQNIKLKRRLRGNIFEDRGYRKWPVSYTHLR